MIESSKGKQRKSSLPTTKRGRLRHILTSPPPVVEDLLRRSYQLEILSLTSQQINAVLEIPVILRTLVSSAVKVTGANGGAAGLVADGRLILDVISDQGTWPEMRLEFAPGQGAPGWVMQAGEPYRTNNTAGDAIANPSFWEPLVVQNLVCVPIHSREAKLLGCLLAHNKPQPFDDDDVRLLQGLAASASVALENAHMLAERREAQARHREREDQLAAIIDTAMDAIITFDADQCITRFNRAAMAMFRCSLSDVLGQPIERLLPERYHRLHRRNVQAFGDSHDTRRSSGHLGVLVGQRADGEEFPAEISISKIEVQGERLYTAIIRDVTERLRAERDLRERERHLTLMNAITHTAIETSSRSEMLTLIAERLCESMHADGCYIALWDETQGRPVPVAAFGPQIASFTALQLDPGAPSLAAAVLEQGHAIGVEDVEQTTLISRKALDMITAHSVLGLPIIADNKKLGAAYIAFREPHAFTAEELALGEQAGRQAALALAKVTHFAQAEERLADLEAINHISTSLRIAPTLDEMLPLVLDETLAVLGTSSGTIALSRSPSDGLQVAATRGWFSQEVTSPDWISQAAQVLRSGRLQVIRKFRTGALSTGPLDLQAGWGGALVPIQTHQEMVGVLGVAVPLPRELTAHEVHLLTTIAEIAGSAIHRTRLHESLEQAYLQTVLALANAMDARDSYTAGHGERLAEMAVAISKVLKFAREEQETLRFAARLHDIGKIGVPDAILRKPGPLDDDEWRIMQQHPTIGAEIIRPVKRLQQAVPIVKHHQEKFDGSGYPDGLAGEAIPLGARILAVVDAYGAITDDRVYRHSCSRAQALEEIRRGAGHQFDPRIVAVFMQVEGKN